MKMGLIVEHNTDNRTETVAKSQTIWDNCICLDESARESILFQMDLTNQSAALNLLPAGAGLFSLTW